MKISLNWLKDYIKLDESPEEISHILTMTGLEVEGLEKIEALKGGLQGVVIGEVLECQKHPNADKLSVTKVDVGGEEPLPIVCGAPNVAKGQKVLVATTGTTLYPTGSEEGFKIKKSKIRGEVSEGMICAEDELGLGTSHDGIMVLDTEMPNGSPAINLFDLKDDVVFEIGLTPNRADAASHLGVARDLKAVLGRDIKWPEVSDFKTEDNSLTIDVKVEDKEGCPRYSGLTISDLTIKESPEWLKTKLMAIGQTPINNVVDATNFILHELGQPLHAFDADEIKGNKIIVKRQPQGTPFITLDEKERKLNANDLMICNEKEGMCIAGVFGGLKSGVSAKTKSIFLESAYFSPEYIRKTSQSHLLKTDSAFRFERGTDPAQTVYALKRAALLIKELAGGKISSDIVDIYPQPVEASVVAMKYSNIDRLIGKKLPKETIKEILQNLDIEVKEEKEEGFTAIVPPYRVDVTKEADVIEEILRIYGYDNIELKDSFSSDYLADFPVVSMDKEQLKASEMLVAAGFYEIGTNSLTKPAYAANPEHDVVILNKLSEDLGVLRQSLLYTGLEVVAHNVNHKQRDLKLFEFGTTYSRIDGKYHEKSLLALWMTGNTEPENWIHKSRAVEFHDIYGIVLKLIHKFTNKAVSNQKITEEIYGYGLEVSAGSIGVAKVGLLNKNILKKAGVDVQTFYAEVDFERLISLRENDLNVSEIVRFPEVRRDLSLVLDKNITFDQIKKITEDKSFGGLLKDINVFDYYVGENIEKHKKAYALSFILQDENKTLTDNVIDKVMKKLINRFESELGAVIRK